MDTMETPSPITTILPPPPPPPPPPPKKKVRKSSRTNAPSPRNKNDSTNINEKGTGTSGTLSSSSSPLSKATPNKTTTSSSNASSSTKLKKAGTAGTTTQATKTSRTVTTAAVVSLETSNDATATQTVTPTRTRRELPGVSATAAPAVFSFGSTVTLTSGKTASTPQQQAVKHIQKAKSSKTQATAIPAKSKREPAEAAPTSPTTISKTASAIKARPATLVNTPISPTRARAATPVTPTTPRGATGSGTNTTRTSSPIGSAPTTIRPTTPTRTRTAAVARRQLRRRQQQQKLEQKQQEQEEQRQQQQQEQKRQPPPPSPPPTPQREQPTDDFEWLIADKSTTSTATSTSSSNNQGGNNDTRLEPLISTAHVKKISVSEVDWDSPQNEDIVVSRILGVDKSLRSTLASNAPANNSSPMMPPLSFHPFEETELTIPKVMTSPTRSSSTGTTPVEFRSVDEVDWNDEMKQQQQQIMQHRHQQREQSRSCPPAGIRTTLSPSSPPSSPSLVPSEALMASRRRRRQLQEYFNCRSDVSSAASPEPPTPDQRRSGTKGRDDQGHYHEKGRKRVDAVPSSATGNNEAWNNGMPCEIHLVPSTIRSTPSPTTKQEHAPVAMAATATSTKASVMVNLARGGKKQGQNTLATKPAATTDASTTNAAQGRAGSPTKLGGGGGGGARRQPNRLELAAGRQDIFEHASPRPTANSPPPNVGIEARRAEKARKKSRQTLFGRQMATAPALTSVQDITDHNELLSPPSSPSSTATTSSTSSSPFKEAEQTVTDRRSQNDVKLNASTESNAGQLKHDTESIIVDTADIALSTPPGTSEKTPLFASPASDPRVTKASGTGDDRQDTIPPGHIRRIQEAFGPDADLYRDILSVGRRANERQLRIAYFRKSRQVLTTRDLPTGNSSYDNEPDRVVKSMSELPRSTTKLLEAVNMAYAILSKSEWRDIYDRDGLVLPTTPSTPSSPSVSWRSGDVDREGMKNNNDIQRPLTPNGIKSPTAVQALFSRVQGVGVGRSILRRNRRFGGNPANADVNKSNNIVITVEDVDMGGKPQPPSRSRIRWNEEVEELLYKEHPDEILLKTQLSSDYEDSDDDESTYGSCSADDEDEDDESRILHVASTNSSETTRERKHARNKILSDFKMPAAFERPFFSDVFDVYDGSELGTSFDASSSRRDMSVATYEIDDGICNNWKAPKCLTCDVERKGDNESKQESYETVERRLGKDQDRFPKHVSPTFDDPASPSLGKVGQGNENDWMELLQLPAVQYGDLKGGAPERAPQFVMIPNKRTKNEASAADGGDFRKIDYATKEDEKSLGDDSILESKNHEGERPDCNQVPRISGHPVVITVQHTRSGLSSLTIGGNSRASTITTEAALLQADSQNQKENKNKKTNSKGCPTMICCNERVILRDKVSCARAFPTLDLRTNNHAPSAQQQLNGYLSHWTSYVNDLSLGVSNIVCAAWNDSIIGSVTVKEDNVQRILDILEKERNPPNDETDLMRSNTF